MSRWKLFGKSKSKKEEPLEFQESSHVEPEENIPMETEDSSYIEKEQENQPLAEYHETLHTGKPASSKSSSGDKYSGSSSDQRIWRDVKAIEENIDNMHISTSRKPTSTFDKRIDRLVKKREKK